MDATAAELRVLGSLLEKQRTTPDAYPLSLNSLRLACNQATNRDPVVEYDEETVRTAIAHLSRRGWVRLASGRGSRAVKYGQLFDEALGLSTGEVAVLTVLMLRGPQTPGELKSRTERLHPFTSLAELEVVLGCMIERELAERLPRQPGQKEARYRQLLGEDAEAAERTLKPAPAVAYGPAEGDDRLDELEQRVRAVEEKLSELLDSLAEPPPG